MGRARRLASVAIAALAAHSGNVSANYACAGPVGYLGVGQNGDLTVSIANSTPIHSICSMTSQGSYTLSVPACKAAYAAILAARLSGKSITLYYNNEPLTCGTLPSWGAVPGTYFVEGPN